MKFHLCSGWVKIVHLHCCVTFCYVNTQQFIYFPVDRHLGLSSFQLLGSVSWTSLYVSSGANIHILWVTSILLGNTKVCPCLSLGTRFAQLWSSLAIYLILILHDTCCSLGLCFIPRRRSIHYCPHFKPSLQATLHFCASQKWSGNIWHCRYHSLLLQKLSQMCTEAKPPSKYLYDFLGKAVLGAQVWALFCYLVFCHFFSIWPFMQGTRGEEMGQSWVVAQMGRPVVSCPLVPSRAESLGSKNKPGPPHPCWPKLWP